MRRTCNPQRQAATAGAGAAAEEDAGLRRRGLHRAGTAQRGIRHAPIGAVRSTLLTQTTTDAILAGFRNPGDLVHNTTLAWLTWLTALAPWPGQAQPTAVQRGLIKFPWGLQSFGHEQRPQHVCWQES